MPKQIQIGPLAYQVVEVAKLHKKAHGVFLYGDINYGKCRIRIDAGLDPQIKRVTLFHEVIHGILNGAGMTDHDEQVVDALAHGMIQVLRDNPELRDA